MTPHKKALNEIRKIEEFVKSSPMPTEGDLKTFLSSENLTEYSDYAQAFYRAAQLRTWHILKSKTNKFK